MTDRIRSFMALASLALLAACGGSDSAAPADAADKYVGTWRSDCEQTTLTPYTDEGPLLATYQLALAQAGPHRLRFTVRYSLYPAASGCSGTPLATLDHDSPDNIYTIDGVAQVNGHTVDRITVDMAALAPDDDGSAWRDGPVIYPRDFFMSRVVAQRDLLSVRDGGLHFGTGPVSDATGYPTALDARPRLQRP